MRASHGRPLLNFVQGDASQDLPDRIDPDFVATADAMADVRMGLNPHAHAVARTANNRGGFGNENGFAVGEISKGSLHLCEPFDGKDTRGPLCDGGSPVAGKEG